ncbi:MAG: transposase [Nitrospira sp.]|nr:transposase [Nitrospira sp.]
MSRVPFSQEHINAALSELSAGRPVREVSRRHGISPNTLYRWRARFVNAKQQDDRARLRSLEEDYQRLKKQFAELALDYAALRTALIEEARGDC